jgi:Rrf2 family protein
MKVNTRICYALRLMADVSKFGGGEPVPLKEVAERQHLSKLYLSQLTAPLKNASLLKSVWGNRGGYLLARPAREIRLLDIIQAVHGPIALAGHLHDANYCDRTDECGCAGIWRLINEEIISILARHTLEDLISRGEIPCACDGCHGVIGPLEHCNHKSFSAGSDDRNRRAEKLNHKT